MNQFFPHQTLKVSTPWTVTLTLRTQTSPCQRLSLQVQISEIFKMKIPEQINRKTSPNHGENHKDPPHVALPYPINEKFPKLRAKVPQGVHTTSIFSISYHKSNPDACNCDTIKISWCVFVVNKMLDHEEHKKSHDHFLDPNLPVLEFRVLRFFFESRIDFARFLGVVDPDLDCACGYCP